MESKYINQPQQSSSLCQLACKCRVRQEDMAMRTPGWRLPATLVRPGAFEARERGHDKVYQRYAPHIWTYIQIILAMFYRYHHIYHTWKKVGILATGCRRYWAKNDAKRQNPTYNWQNQPQNERKKLPKRQVKFFGCRLFWILFQVWCTYIHMRL